MVSRQEKEDTFSNELALIFDESIKEFTRLCVISAPDYFFTDCPASSTGKYHPVDELAHDGTIVHTKKVVTLAYDLCKAYSCENRRDEIISACIIHDLRKQGLEKYGHTVINHPDLAVKLVDQIQSETMILTDDSHEIIRNCVGYHYGPWSVKPWLKPIGSYTNEELCVFTSDFISHKKFLVVNYRRGGNDGIGL